MAYAIAIAARTGATLRILTVLVTPSIYATPDVMGGGDYVAEVIERQGQELLHDAMAQAHQAEVMAASAYQWGSIPDAILQTATDTSCDLIVLGTRQVSGWKRLRLGHIANAVASKAHQPVLVVKQPPAAGPTAPLGRRILVATGGSPWSDMAVDHAIMLAQSQRFSVCLLHVMPGRRRHAAAEAEGQTILARAEARATSASVATTVVLANGDVPTTIVDTAIRQDCDGIILGSRGAAGLKRLMLGSISNAVAVKTPLPVLIVKRFFPA